MKKILLLSLASFVSGMAAVLSFAPYHFVPLMAVSVIALLAVMGQASSKKTAFLYGFCFGMGHFGAGLYWITNALYKSDSVQLVWLLNLATPLFFGSWGGCFIGLVTLTYHRFKQPLAKVLIFPALFTLAEYLRGVLFTGFPWNPMGSMWVYDDRMIQIASIVGVYGLTFITVLGFTLLYPLKPVRLGAAVLLFAAVYYLGFTRVYKTPSYMMDGAVLRIVQGNIPQEDKWDRQKLESNLNRYLFLSRNRSDVSTVGEITHVVWPETAFPFIIKDNSTDNFFMERLVSAVENGGRLITGAARVEGRLNTPNFRMFNSAIVTNDLGEIETVYDKSHLVPFGEYVPFSKIMPIKRIVPGWVDFSKGKGLETLDLNKAPPVGILICYEIIFPGKVASREYRPAWLLNLTNDAWYGDSMGPYQHLAAARMRAVEEGLPVIRAANTGISAVIDPYGRVLQSLALNTEGSMDSMIPAPILWPTWFGKHGNTTIILISLGFALAALLIEKIKGRTPLTITPQDNAPPVNG